MKNADDAPSTSSGSSSSTGTSSSSRDSAGTGGMRGWSLMSFLSGAIWTISSPRQAWRWWHMSADENTTAPPIGAPMTLDEYAQLYKGNTTTAQQHREGSRALQTEGFSHIQLVKGDYYGPMRAVLYQALRKGCCVQILEEIHKIQNELMYKFSPNASDEYQLQDWTFGGQGTSITREEDTVEATAKRCVQCLIALVEKVQRISGDGRANERAQEVTSYLNGNHGNDDVMVMEGIKICMMLRHIELYDGYHNQHIPAFVPVINAREDCSTPARFLTKLDRVGNDAGLEDIELCLLANTLGVSIRVYNVLDYAKKDSFVWYANNDMARLTGTRAAYTSEVCVMKGEASNYHIIT